jgi:uncharacterized protein HemX
MTRQNHDAFVTLHSHRLAAAVGMLLTGWSQQQQQQQQRRLRLLQQGQAKQQQQQQPVTRGSSL